MAKKTIELTIQVAAEEQGHVHDGLGLQQHEAGAQEEHLAVGPRRRTGAKRKRIASESTATIAMPRRLSAGIIGRRRYRNGQSSVGTRSIAVASTRAATIFWNPGGSWRRPVSPTGGASPTPTTPAAVRAHSR